MDFETFDREEVPDINDAEFDAIVEHLMEDESNFDKLDRKLPNINDEEYESLMPQSPYANPKEFYDSLKRRYGSRWSLAAETLNKMWRKKNPGKLYPGYLRKGLIRKAQMGYREFHRIFKEVKKSFPSAKFLKLKFREQGDQLQVKPWGKGKWTNIYTGNNLNSSLSPFVIKALGAKDKNKTKAEKEIMKTIRKEYPDAKFNLLSLRYGPRNEIQLKYLGKTTSLKSGWYDFKKLDGRLNTKLNPFLPDVISNKLGAANLGIRFENIDSQMSRIFEEGSGELEDLLEEKNNLLSEESKYEEDIRKRNARIEQFNADKERLENNILDSERTEEERMVAQVKADLIDEQIEELEEENEQTENRLGLTSRERIMRMLQKYGIPAALASLLAAVISLVIALGISIKENGIALERQGKEMAFKNPGLLDSVVALIEKTAGRILKFVGNNMWILVVAVGLLVLLKI